MKNVAIYARYLDNSALSYLQQLISKLYDYYENIVLYKPIKNQINKKIKLKANINTFTNHHDLINKVDLLISLGGDGTLLDTVTLVRDSGIPILGINTGRLGFLASIAKNEINKTIEYLERGNYSLDKRTLITVESDKKLFNGINFALNDFTIHKKDTSSMITIHAFLNGEFLNTYWADGLIVATPTGSTGYSLSCAGPIIFPRSGNFVITPVAPHNLNVRPIVVSDNNIISFEIEGRSKNFLTTLDSRSETIDSTVQLAVKKASFEIKLLRLSSENFLNTLREKLMWGLDNRN